LYVLLKRIAICISSFSSVKLWYLSINVFLNTCKDRLMYLKQINIVGFWSILSSWTSSPNLYSTALIYRIIYRPLFLLKRSRNFILSAPLVSGIAWNFSFILSIIEKLSCYVLFGVSSSLLLSLKMLNGWIIQLYPKLFKYFVNHSLYHTVSW